MSSARIIDGRAEAALLRAEVAEGVRAFTAATGVTPALRVVQVGEHPASLAYVATKARMAASVGIEAAIERLPSDTGRAALLERLDALNRDPAVHGILVQLPLPAAIEAAALVEAVDPAKDVDGFHPLNVGRLAAGSGPPAPGLLVPCTPLGCLRLLERTAGGLAGRRAVVLGRSNIVGRPMAQLLLRADCTVTVAHSRSRDLPDLCREAEILIAAVGRPELVRGDWIAEGALVIDVGINRAPTADGRGRLVGDVAFEEALGRAGAITPVPGGVGPMTVASLLHNTLIAARNQVAGRSRRPSRQT